MSLLNEYQVDFMKYLRKNGLTFKEALREYESFISTINDKDKTTAKNEAKKCLINRKNNTI